MEWNDDGIEPAIQKAKSMNVLLIVVIYKDENEEKSSSLMDLMEDCSVTALLNKDTCVAIKLKHEGQDCKQFHSRYFVDMVPSIYFINSHNRIAVEVAGGDQLRKETLLSSIHRAMSKVKIISRGVNTNPDSVRMVHTRSVPTDQAKEVIRQAFEDVPHPSVPYDQAEELLRQAFETRTRDEILYLYQRIYFGESPGTSFVPFSAEEEIIASGCLGLSLARTREFLAKRQEEELQETNDEDSDSSDIFETRTEDNSETEKSNPLNRDDMLDPLYPLRYNPRIDGLYRRIFFGDSPGTSSASFSAEEEILSSARTRKFLTKRETTREEELEETNNEDSDSSDIDMSHHINAEENESPDTSSTTTWSLEERVTRAKELLASRRKKYLEDTKDKETSTEKERGQQEKQMQNFQRTREERESLKAAEERRKDREETELAGERIKAHIEQDISEKQAKFDVQTQPKVEEKKGQEKAAFGKKALHAEKLAAARSTLARILFRLPHGGTRTNAFSAEAPLSDVYKYVREELFDVITIRSGFSLYVTFPRSLLDEKPMDLPLRDLGLAPSGTILVLPKSTSIINSVGSEHGFMYLVWLLLTPLTIFWGLLTSFVATTTPSTNRTTPRIEPFDSDAIQNPRKTEPAASAARSDGHITSQRNSSDDDEENKT